MTVEGMARQLDPSYKLFGEAEPVVRRAFINRYMPDKMLKRGKRNLMEAAHLLAALPKELRKLLQAARSGSLTVNIELTRLEDFANALRSLRSGSGPIFQHYPQFFPSPFLR